MNILKKEPLFSQNCEIATLSPLAAKHQPHNHEFYELFYITSGKVTHIYNDKKQQLETHDCVFIHPNDVHEFRGSETCVLRNLLFTTNMFDKLKSAMPDTFDIVEQLFGKVFRLNKEIVDLTENTAITFSSENDVGLKTALGLNMIWNILTFIISKNPTSTLRRPKIIEMIVEHLNRTYMLPDCSKRLNSLPYSRTYLCAKFKDYMGVSIVEYLNDVRLGYAIYYLKNTNFSLSQIIEKIGIESLSYFNKIFKQKYNTTPIKFRNFPHLEQPTKK